MSVQLNYGNDTDQNKMHVIAHQFAAVKDLPTDAEVWVKVGINSYAVVEDEILVDTTNVPQFIVDASRELEEIAPTLRYPYALVLKEVDYD